MKRQGLGIDAGGSTTGWLLVDTSGTEIASGRTGGITGHLFREPGVLSHEGEQSVARLQELLAEAARAGRPSGVVMGAAGLDGGSQVASYLSDLICQSLDLPADAVVVDNDMVIAYRTVFEPGEGVVVYGGTGSIAFHMPRIGDPVRIGGHGYLIDDAGGGYWIGKHGLRAVLRWQDDLGMPSSRPLAREIYRQLGTDDWPRIREYTYSGGRSRVAALAQAVVRAAAQRDAAAIDILENAGRELARLVNSVLGRLGLMLPVSVMGGVTSMGPVLLEALQEALPAGSALTVRQDDPVQAAAQLAVRFRSADRSN